MKKSKFDHTEAKRLYSEGLSVREIGKRLGVSHTAVNNVVKNKVKNNGHEMEITTDMALEKIAEALEALRVLPGVKAERDKYKKGYENLKDMIAAQEKESKKKKDLEQRFKLAQQQAVIGGAR